MSRFHEKYHRTNHHTYQSTTNADAGHDPIASPSNPFMGDFVLNGGLSALVPASSAYSAAFLGAPVGIGTSTPKYIDPNSQLVVVGSSYITGDLHIIGNLTTSNVSVTSNNVTNLSTRSLSISSNGLVPALSAIQYGNTISPPQKNPIAVFSYKDGNNTIQPALYIDGYSMQNGTAVAGNIGVGTSTPNADFTVNGSLSANSGIYGQKLYIGASPFPVTDFVTQPDIILNSNSSTGGLFLSQANTNGYALKISDQAGTDPTPLIIDNDGNIGIGLSAYNTNSKITIIPASTQTVAISATGNIYSDGGTLYAQNIGIGTKQVSTTADAVINSNNPNGGLFISQNSPSGYSLKVSDVSGNDQTPFLIDNNGNVVVGGLVAAEKFNVIGGNINIQSNGYSLKFKDLSGSQPSFNMQNDNNFVFYGTNTTGGGRPIWSIFQRSSSSNFVISTPTLIQNTLNVQGGNITTTGNITATNVIVNSDIKTSGNITTTGSITANSNSTFGGVNIGFVSTGYYGDSTNLALRPKTGSVYFQNAGGTYSTLVVGNSTINAVNNPISNCPNTFNPTSTLSSNLTASRLANTQYTNNTGRILIVYLIINNTTNTTTSIQINDTTVLNINCYNSKSGGNFIVPAGATYKVTTSDQITSWIEF